MKLDYVLDVNIKQTVCVNITHVFPGAAHLTA